VMVAENKILKRLNKFDKAVTTELVTSELANCKPLVSIICTNTNGVITYSSPGAEKLLGYENGELVGNINLLKIHNPPEILARAKELELELGKKVAPGLGVLIEKIMRNKGKEDIRIWNYLKKDGSLVAVQVSIRPLFDEKSIFGFVEVASEVEPQQLTPLQPIFPQQVLSPDMSGSNTFLTSPGLPVLTEEQILSTLFDANNSEFALENLDLDNTKWI